MVYKFKAQILFSQLFPKYYDYTYHKAPHIKMMVIFENTPNPLGYEEMAKVVP